MPFGGRITNIGGTAVSKLIEGPPTGALSVAGGRSQSSGAGSSFEGIFKWGTTNAECTGIIRTDGHAETKVTSTLSSFSAKNDPILFETDLLKISMLSDHPTKGQPSIMPTEVVFGGTKGMFLNGKQIRVEIDDDLKSFPTLAQFESEYRTKQTFYTKYKSRFRRSATKAAIYGERLPRVGGYVSTSIVRSITWNGKKIDGHVLSLTGFGRIYFGELLMNENNRRLTMIRLVMGSSVKAEAACAEADPNGSWD
jgi:hypothetical protein